MVFSAHSFRLVGDIVQVFVELLQNAFQFPVQLVLQLLLLAELVQGLSGLRDLLLMCIIYEFKLVYGLEVQLAHVLFHVVHFDVKIRKENRSVALGDDTHKH